MAHTALGNVSAEVYNETQDKTITLTEDLDVGTLLVAISLGYGTDGTIDLTGVSDSQGNSWQWVKSRAASPSRFAMIAWSRISSAMTTSDTVTINLQGTHSRSFAVLRGYEGLGAIPHGQGASNGYNLPASVGALGHGTSGRAIAACFYPTQFSETDFWANSFTQTVVEEDSSNVDMYTVGERTYTGSGTVTPTNNISVATAWIMAAVALPEQAMPTSSRPRPARVVAAGI